MAALLTIESTIKTSQKLFDFTIKCIDDLENVVPEGKALQKECELFQHIIHLVVNKPHLPVNDILNDVNKKMMDTNKMIDDFISDDIRDRSFFSKVEWKLHRLWIAYNLRPTFEATTEHLKVCRKKIQEISQLSSQLNRPTAHSFRDDMVNDESFQFWMDICGEDMQTTTLSVFTEIYQRKYKVDWDSSMIERIRRVACGEGTHLTLYGYTMLTKSYGFPLDVNKLPLLIDSHADVSSETRMEVARMINELVTYYSTKEMRDLIVAIFTWYKGCNKRDKDAWQERANEWARVILANRGNPTDELDERGKLAVQVDLARRTYSFFFQRYMAVFKFGPLSKDMFAEVDFPGKARIFEFIEHVGPLDYANFHVVMHGKPEDWESKEPKVYKFLKELIATEKQAKEECKIKAIDAAKPLKQNELDDIKLLSVVNNDDPCQSSKIHPTH